MNKKQFLENSFYLLLSAGSPWVAVVLVILPVCSPEVSIPLGCTGLAVSEIAPSPEAAEEPDSVEFTGS